MTAAGPSLSVSVFTADALDTFAHEWEALSRETPDSPPFAHPAWYRVWLAHFGPVRAVFVSMRDSQGVLRGVIPLSLEGTGAAGLGNPKIQDYSGVAIATGWEGEVVDTLLAWAGGESIAKLRLWGILERTALAEAISRAAVGSRWSIEAREEAVAPAADVGPDWEAFVASLSKKNRHELRRKLRNLEAAGDVRLETIAEATAVREATRSLIRMMRDSHEGKVRFLTPEMEAFFLELGPALAEAGFGRTWRLTVDGREAAVLLGFDKGQTRFLYNSGFEPALGRLAVGLLSKALAMKAGAEEGLSRFDFLRGNEDYKRRLGGHEQKVLEFTVQRQA